MKLAVLVLAHENVDQLNALVAHLATDFDVFVHLDRKGAVGINDVVAGERIHVIKRRRVFWGSYGMVLATLDLMALAAQGHFDRYVLISGSDVPLRSNSAIVEFFAEHPNEEFIECQSLPLAGAGENGWLDRVTRFYLPSARGRAGWRGRLHHEAFWAFYHANSRLRISRSVDGMQFHGGSNWWNLTDGAVRGVLDLIERDRSFLRRFRWTSCSDEIVIQTALMRIGLGGRITRTSLRFVDWGNCGAHPRTLSTDDYGRIRASDMLFARKVDRSVDATLEQMLWSDVCTPTA